MKHLFNNIEETEKDRILEMHKSATKNNYLMTEQGQTTTSSDERMKKAKAEDLKKRKEEEARKREEEEKKRKKEEEENLFKKYKNITVNLYADEENKDIARTRVRISKIDLKPDGTLKINLSGFMSGYLIFNCEKPSELMLSKPMTVRKKAGSSGVKGDDGTSGKDGEDNTVVLTKLYNKKLTSSFQKDFCTTSSGGKSVPKADYASTNRPSSQNIA